MIPASLNLYVKQGADFALLITVLQGDLIHVTADVQAGAASIPIKPLNQSIATGRKLLFGDVLIILDDDAPIGTTALPIVATALPLTKNTKGQLISDLTDCTARSRIKGKLHNSESPKSFVATVFGDDGQVELKLTNAQSANLPANLDFGIVMTDDELQSRKFQPKDYLWDVDISYPDDRIESPAQGLIVVAPDIPEED